MKSNIIVLLAVIVMAGVSCTGCRISKNIQKSTYDSTVVWKAKYDSLWEKFQSVDSVSKRLFEMYGELGIVFDPFSPVLGLDSTLAGYDPIVKSGDITLRSYEPFTEIKTDADGATTVKTNLPIKSINNKQTKKEEKYDSLAKVTQELIERNKALEKNSQVKKTETIIQKETVYKTAWWVWLIIATLAILWIRKQFF